MTSQDLLDPNKTPLNLYEILSLPNPIINPGNPSPDANAISRSYRKASLLAHPDKAPPEKRKEYSDRFHRLQIAYDLLSNEESRAIYDARLERERRQKAEKESFSKKRKTMMEELKKRESAGRDGFLNAQSAVHDGWQTPEKTATKRTHPDNKANGSSTPLNADQEQEMRRLAAEGARRRAEFEERQKRRRSGRDQDVTSLNAPITRPDGTPLPETPLRNGNGTSGYEHKTSTIGHEGEARRSSGPSFSFSPGSGREPVKASTQGLASGRSPSAPGGSLFESTMAKLKEAQRRKEEEKSKQETYIKPQQTV